MARRGPATGRSGGRHRALLSLGLALQLACVPGIRERCRLVTEPTPAPALPADLAELDGLLVRRATEMAHASRELTGSLAYSFRASFAEQALPEL